MGIIRNAANRKIRGRIGDTTYYVANDRQIARQALNSSNYGETARRTEAQQGNRVRWANLVQFYKLSKSWMSKAFENKKSGQSDYNRFMQLNLNAARIYFTKEAVAASSCVVDDFTISQGSLRQINVQQIGNVWATDIQLGSLTIDASTTIADFTTAILHSNNWAKEGMQISFVSYQQQTDSLGYPVAICTAYELTLLSTDTRLVRSFLPEFCSQKTTSGTLGTNDNISVGGFAYILSLTSGGKTLVSTQKLVTNNIGFITQYSSDRMRDLAIYSYGLNKASFLDSGSNPVTRAQQPIYITGLTIEGNVKVWQPGGAGPKRFGYNDKVVTLFFSAPLPADAAVSSVEFYLETGGRGLLKALAIADNRMSISGTASTASVDGYTDGFTAIVGGVNYTLTFDNEPEIHDE